MTRAAAGDGLCTATHPVTGEKCAKKPHAPGTQHKGKGAAGAIWGGRAPLGPVGADARARRGLSPAKPRAARACSVCMAAETIIVVRKATKTREAVTESSLEGGKCRDTEACGARQPALFDLEEIPTNATNR